MQGSEESTMQGSEESTMDPDATVRFLSIRLLEPTKALAMWAPPNGTMPHSYTAELSYDANEWRRLNLEEPDSTFIEFPVTEQKEFHVRVTPEGGAPAMETFTLGTASSGTGAASAEAPASSETPATPDTPQFQRGKSGKAGKGRL
jgi:hypothetical protein